MASSQKELVLITGSSGLVGTQAAQKLAESFTVAGLDRDSCSASGLEFIHCDIGSAKDVRDAFDKVRANYGQRIASVIHLAEYYDSSGAPSPHYDAINVRGTGHLLRELRNFQVEQFIFVSTMLVHAPCESGQRINEDWPLDPKWAYPQSKFEAEQLIRDQHGAMPVVLLRIAATYDDGCHAPLLAHQIQRIHERSLLSSVFPGDSTHGQACLHVDDLVQALLLLVQRRAQMPSELTLMLGESETLSYYKLQYKLGRLIHNEDWDTREIPKALATTGAWIDEVIPLGEKPFIEPWRLDLADDHYVLDCTRAHTLLGWQPRHSLLDTLPQIIARLKAEPLAWYQDNKLDPPAWLEESGGRYDRRHGL
ncbi:MAG: NAD(P)-dependent oxidoreductase [Gammaproteobacteria bacterium]